jgi:hypothetical protein
MRELQQMIADRLRDREYHRRQVAAMQAAGQWYEASEYITDHIDPLNEWLWERGVW